MPRQDSDIRACLWGVTAINQPCLSGGFACQFSPEVQPLEVSLVDRLAGLISSGDR